MHHRDSAITVEKHSLERLSNKFRSAENHSMRGFIAELVIIEKSDNTKWSAGKVDVREQVRRRIKEELGIGLSNKVNCRDQAINIHSLDQFI